jgi:hypothetical protein
MDNPLFFAILTSPLLPLMRILFLASQSIFFLCRFHLTLQWRKYIILKDVENMWLIRLILISSSRFPDFKHKKTQEAVWIED